MQDRPFGARNPRAGDFCLEAWVLYNILAVNSNYETIFFTLFLSASMEYNRDILCPNNFLLLCVKNAAMIVRHILGNVQNVEAGIVLKKLN